MSAQSVESVLSKAMSDTAFADALFAEPAKALAGYDLTAEEIAKFKGLTRALFDAMVPEERKSYMWCPGGRKPNHNETALTIRK